MYEIFVTERLTLNQTTTNILITPLIVIEKAIVLISPYKLIEKIQSNITS